MISFLRYTYNWCVFMYNLPTYLQLIVFNLYIHQYLKSLDTIDVNDEQVE